MMQTAFVWTLSFLLMATLVSTLYDRVIYDMKSKSKCVEETRGPTWKCGWKAGLSRTVDYYYLKGTIAAYKIRWFNGRWSGWFVPGVNDLVQAGITNELQLQKGACDGETLVIKCKPSCSTQRVHWKRGNSDNEIGTCSHWQSNIYLCYDQERYYMRSDSNVTLYIANVTLNYSSHVTNWSCNVKCMDNSTEKYEVLVKPCTIGFLVNVARTPDAIDVSVRHVDLHLSHGLQIKEFVTTNVLAQCIWNATFRIADCLSHSADYSVHGMPSGLMFRIHDAGESYKHNFTLYMDGQSLTIAVTPDDYENRSNTSRMSHESSSTYSTGCIAVIASILGVLLVVVHVLQ